MFARLWWKDARQFWPIWAVLVVAAAACQWLLLRYGGNDARSGILILLALGWVLLYGFAVSAAAFAGERENNTLAFLDMMPVDRRVLWGGKATFAVTTTLALACLLAAMAWLWTDRFGEIGPLSRLQVKAFGASVGPKLSAAVMALAYVALLLEILGWGLFWSAASSNAMVAAVLAMLCSAFGLSSVEHGWTFDAEDLASSLSWRLAIALATSIASLVLVTLGGRAGWSWGDLMTRERAGKIVRRIRVRPRRARRRILSTRVRVLVWQTNREVWPVWWRLLAIGYVVPMVCVLAGMRFDRGLVFLLFEVLFVVAGVSVFGVENRGQTHRFLAHHGARPGVVWGVKLVVWGVWLLPLLLPLGFWREDAHGSLLLPWGIGVLIAMTGWVVGLLCGMAIRRGITAGLVAVVGLVVVGLPQLALLSWQLMSGVVALVVPLALLAISRAWSADWMLDRPGPGRWVRLGSLTSVAILFVFGVHVGSRVWGVPDMGPGFDVPAFVQAARVDPKDNAAGLYREALQRSEVVGGEAARAHRRGEEFAARGAPERRKERDAILDLIRRASSMPRCQFVRLDRVTMFGPYSSRAPFGDATLESAVAESVRKRREQGDLAGARDDLLVMFRMARHMSGPVPMGVTYQGLNIERLALGMAMEWAVDTRQTPELLLDTLNAYQMLPPMPPIIDTIRAESILVQNTLDLPAADLAVLATPRTTKSAPEFESVTDSVHVAAVTAPWEIARARRALWPIFELIGREASMEPCDRGRGNFFDGRNNEVTGPGPSSRRIRASQIYYAQTTTPLTFMFLPPRDMLTDANDRNEVARRALVQILALRLWQTTHDGKLPETLDELVKGGTLPALPADPYLKNQPFHYVRSGGQKLLPLGRLELYWSWTHEADVAPTTDDRLLYSIGPDKWDDGASQSFDTGTGHGDIVFPLPDMRELSN